MPVYYQKYYTRSYTELQDRFKTIAGLSEIETVDKVFLNQAVNLRIRRILERFPWPDFTVVGEAVLLNDDSGSNADVTGRDTIRIFNVTTTIPATNQLLWNTDTVFRINTNNPATTNHSEEYTFFPSQDPSGNPVVEIIHPTQLSGANSGAGTTVYVTYRKHFDAVVKNTNATNATTDAGSSEFTSGFFGNGLSDNPNIPFTFFEYAAHGAYSDFLRGEGQTEKAQVEMQNADAILLAEIDKVREQSRGFRHDILQYRPPSQFRRNNFQAGGFPVQTYGVSPD